MPGIHSLHMRGSWKPLLVSAPKQGSRLYLQDAALFNPGMSYTLGKVRKPGMVLKDKQLRAI